MQAYLTISLDAAGLFRFLAFWVANKGGSSGKRLYLYFWIFFVLLAVAVGNVSLVCSLLLQLFIPAQDPVVLSGTPFIAYFTRIAGCVPRRVRSILRITFDPFFAAYLLLQPGYMRNFVLRTWVCLQILSPVEHTTEFY